MGDANGCRADVEVAMLVVTAMWWNGVEVEFDVNGILGKKVVIVIGMGKNVELAEPISPLLRSVCCGWVGKEQSDVDEACCKNGLCSFNVLRAVDQKG